MEKTYTYNFPFRFFPCPFSVKIHKMKAEDKTAIPRVRIAVIGHADVGKSGKFQYNINNNTQ